MKRTLALILTLVVAVSLAGCASTGYGTQPAEIHPGHVGHEIH